MRRQVSAVNHPVVGDLANMLWSVLQARSMERPRYHKPIGRGRSDARTEVAPYTCKVPRTDAGCNTYLIGGWLDTTASPCVGFTHLMVERPGTTVRYASVA